MRRGNLDIEHLGRFLCNFTIWLPVAGIAATGHNSELGEVGRCAFIRDRVAGPRKRRVRGTKQAISQAGANTEDRERCKRSKPTMFATGQNHGTAPPFYAFGGAANQGTAYPD